MELRLQKILSQAGIASRRKAEELITEGRIKVNGKVAELGSKADPDKDKILFDNKPVATQKKVYLALNKPKGYLSTVTDDRNRKTIMDLVKSKQKVFPVGRLDKDAQGLILITNDGDWANKIMHPRYEVSKTYEVKLDHSISNQDLAKLKKGVVVDKRKVTPSLVKSTKGAITITIHEGRKHIIKRMFEELGYTVTFLKRIQIGQLRLGTLPLGKTRTLTIKEIEKLSSSA